TVGERLIDAQYWTSTQYVGTVFGGDTAIFGVHFADGRIKGYPRDTGPGGVSVHYARYVRGDTDYGTNDFVDNGDGTITDNATGLMWSKDDSSDSVNTGPRSGMLWGEALTWVQQKNDDSYLDYDDWRLPNAKEMQSIVDYSRAPDVTGSAAIDPIFNITEITNEAYSVDYPWFWTGTTHARDDGSGPGAVYICFGRAMGYFGPPGMEEWIDVHGAGAQRSDQKDGNFSGYNYVPDGYYFGPSPQGDATRMYNYVRCVRDVTQQETPIEINMIPDESPVIVPAGGSFSFTGILINNTDQTQTPDVGIFVRIPGPSLYGPVQLFHNIPLSPFDTLISTGVIQEVPLGAIPGDYEYVAYAGDYPNNVVDSAFFPFTIMTPKNTNNKYWKLSGWFEGEDTILSTNTMLIGTYPNPFNATTTISFDLTKSADVSLTVYNLIGQEVEILLDGNMEAGKHNVNWDASFYSSGIYFYKLSAGGKVLTKRMILLK
ncbi:MAG: DUF1566 domain-containing protein, partial [candidate division Zixibacteria bacterium]|nr:DUF1566 domain-containing protein [candidate division Zixibacteria bacterium]